MQIIPGVWNEFGADGNGDGFRNPNNVYDAVTTVAVYLCSEGDDLKRPRDLVASLLRYQHSKDFVATVLRWMRVYSKSAVLVPNATGKLATPKPTGNVERNADPREVPEVPDDTYADADDDREAARAAAGADHRQAVDPGPITTPTVRPTRPTHTPTGRRRHPTPTPTPRHRRRPPHRRRPHTTPTPTPTDTPSGSPCAAETNPTPCTQGSGSHG